MQKKLDWQKFIEFWSQFYYDPDNQDRKYYYPHLREKFFKPRNVICLLKWKLQKTYRFHANRYEELVRNYINQLNDFKKNKDSNFKYFLCSVAEKFSKQLPIKFFILHICQPDKFPIIDQHTYRSFIFLTKNKITRGFIPSSVGLDRYLEFRNFIFKIQEKTGLTLRDIDRALMAFGQFLDNPQKFLKTDWPTKKLRE